jgi:hypothetical protein
MTGIVKQLDSIGGIVIECSCVTECMAQNQDLSQSQTNCMCKVKKCLLSGNPDHGNRCAAYPMDSTTWLIDDDPTKIKQIITNDFVKRV